MNDTFTRERRSRKCDRASGKVLIRPRGRTSGTRGGPLNGSPHAGLSERLPAAGVAVLAMLALVVGSTFAAPLRPTRAALNPEFVAYQEALGTMALPLTTTEEGQGLGLLPSPVDLSHMTGLSPSGFYPQDILGLPAQYDLRSLGRVSSIRNQGGCGACWSFAAMASLESWLLTTPLETWDLSENNLKECHGFDWGPCEGGNSFLATAYFARRSGPVSESDDPYRAYNTGCTSGLAVRKYVLEALFLPDKASALDNATIKQAVMTYGAIGTDMYWDGAYYASGTRAYYYSGTAVANHAVAIVGWDDTFNRGLFTSTPAGDGAWIVRNSWGTSWGDGGYFYASYYDTKIGRGNVAFVNATALDGTTLSQYDPLGWITNWGYGSNTAWAANVFTASSSGTIRGVGTFASTVNTGYLIQVKDGLNGTILATKSGTWPFAGYHTVDLDAPVSVSAGHTFVIAIRYTTPGYTYPLPAECYEAGYSSAATASAGQSYISPDGSTWQDIVTPAWGDPTCNFCIKAIAGPATGPQPPALVTNFAASDGEDAQSTLTWTNPSDSDLAQVVVERKTGSYPTSHTDGTTVYDNGSPTPGGTVSSVDTGLVNGTTYYYAAFSRDTGNLWNDTVLAGSNADAGTPSLVSGPVGYWRFNEGSGTTANDSSGTGNRGTVYGASWTSSVDGSTALSFVGPTDRVEVPNAASLNPSNALTLEAWIKLDGSGTTQTIIDKAYTSHTPPYYQYLLLADNRIRELRFDIALNGTRWVVTSSGANLLPGTWFHVAGVYDGQSIKVYVNGVLKGSQNVGAATISSYSTALYIGKHRNSDVEKFVGAIDEVRIHNRALLPSEFNLLPLGAPAPTGAGPDGPVQILVKPNPARFVPTVIEASDPSVVSISIDIYNLAGERVFASGWLPGRRLEWDLRNDEGELLANGVYLFIARVRDANGSERRSAVGKVFIAR